MKLNQVLYYQVTHSEISSLHLEQNPDSTSGQHGPRALGNLFLLYGPILLLSFATGIKLCHTGLLFVM